MLCRYFEGYYLRRNRLVLYFCYLSHLRKNLLFRILLVPAFLSYVATICTHVFNETASGETTHLQLELPSFILNMKIGFNSLPHQRIPYLSSLLTISSIYIGILVGYTQADIVTASGVFKLFELGIDTLSSKPSNCKAFPTCPVVHSGPLYSIPVLLFPDETTTVFPFPS